MHRDMNLGPLSDVPEWKAGRIEGKPGARGWYYRDATPSRYVDDANRDRMPVEISVDYACEVMQRKHHKPFFIGVGLTKPHTPLYVPDECFDRYPIEEVTLPLYLESDLMIGPKYCKVLTPSPTGLQQTTGSFAATFLGNLS